MRIRSIFIIAVMSLLSMLLMAAAPAPDCPPASTSTEDISFTVTPTGKGARVAVTVSSAFTKVEAKTIQTDNWTDISRKMYVDITEDSTVYVQATDRNGEITARSVFVKLSGGTGGMASQQSPPQGNSTTTAKPSESGAGTTTQPPSETATSTTPPPSETASTTTPPPSSTATTTDDPSGGDTSAPASPPAAPVSTGTPAATDEAPKEVNGVITVGNKKFVTIQTRDEKIFYLIIDGDRSEDNVYLVSEVTTEDLMSFAKDDAADSGQPDPSAGPASLIDGGMLPAPTEPVDIIPVDGGEETAATEEPPTEEMEPTEDEADKANPIPGWIVIILLAMIVAFAGYMFLVVLPRKKAKEAYVDNDEDDIEEDYEEAPEGEAVPPEVQAALEDENPLEADDDEEY